MNLVLVGRSRMWEDDSLCGLMVCNRCFSSDRDVNSSFFNKKWSK